MGNVHDKHCECMWRRQGTVGVLKFIHAKFWQHPKVGKIHFNNYFLQNSVLRSCVLHTASKKNCAFLCVWPSFFGGLWFIHFGATANDLGHLGLWVCSPFLHTHTNVDQLDSWIRVNTQTSTNKQVFRIIQAYQLFNKLIPNTGQGGGGGGGGWQQAAALPQF